MQKEFRARQRMAVWGVVLAAMCCLALPAYAAEELPAEPININAATVDELAALPGIGHVIGLRIGEYRKQNRRFTKNVELMNVNGIGERTFEGWKDSITVQGTDTPRCLLVNQPFEARKAWEWWKCS